MTEPEKFLTLSQLRVALGDYLPAGPTNRTIYKWMELRGMPYNQMGARNRRIFKLSLILRWLDGFNRNADVPASGRRS